MDRVVSRARSHFWGLPPQVVFINMDRVVSRARSHFWGLAPQVVFINMVIYNLQNNNMAEENNLHVIIAFACPGLLGFLQLKNPSPFQIHPKTSLTAIASFLAYCFILYAKLKRFPINFIITNILMEVLASLSLASLALMLLPDHTKWGESLKFIAYTLLFLTHCVAFIIRTRYGQQKITRATPPLLPY